MKVFLKSKSLFDIGDGYHIGFEFGLEAENDDGMLIKKPVYTLNTTSGATNNIPFVGITEYGRITGYENIVGSDVSLTLTAYDADNPTDEVEYEGVIGKLKNTDVNTEIGSEPIG